MSASLDTAPPGWSGILDTNEVILWQGQPAPGVRAEWRNAFEALFMVAWTSFSVFWMIMASQAGGIFWMFGLIFFFIGMYHLVGQHFYKAYLRRHTYYTLTSQRAFIARNAWGRKTLDSYPIPETGALNLQTRGKYTDVNFSTRRVRTKNSSYEVPIGFQRLTEGNEVMGLIRQIQAEAQRGAGTQDTQA